MALLKRVAAELPLQLKQIFNEHQYTVTMAPDESAVLVADDAITVQVFLTSTLLRDPQQQGKSMAPSPLFLPNSKQNEQFLLYRISLGKKFVNLTQKSNKKTYKTIKKNEKRSEMYMRKIRIT